MRISHEDRRRLDRRLRDRLPSFLRAGLKKSRPLALFVAATVCLSPEAIAKVKESKSEHVLVMSKEAPNEFEVSYDPQEFKGAPENPTKGLSDRIMEEVSGLLDRMWRGTNRTQLDKLMTKDPTPDSYGLHIAAMKAPPKTQYSDGNKIIKHLSVDLQKAGSKTVKDRVNILDNLKSGVGFNLDLSEVGESKSSDSKSKGKVRYGLVLKNIKIASKGQDRAAIDDSMDELQYAGHADVEWTIGPLEEEEGRRIFNIKNVKKAKQDDSLWSRIRIPKASFTGSVTPQNIENFASIKDDENLPGMKAQIKQVEDYYVIDYATDSKGEKLLEEHTFKVPIKGTLEIGRRFDDKFHVIQTSAYNILVDKRLPLVSVHYMNMEQRYVGSVGKDIDGHSISFTASSQGTGTAPEAVRKKKKQDTYMQERYGLKYSKKL